MKIKPLPRHNSWNKKNKRNRKHQNKTKTSYLRQKQLCINILYKVYKRKQIICYLQWLFRKGKGYRRLNCPAGFELFPFLSFKVQWELPKTNSASKSEMCCFSSFSINHSYPRSSKRTLYGLQERGTVKQNTIITICRVQGLFL